jgi:hypothetical protein
MNQQDTPTASGGVTFTTGSTDFLAPDGTSASINKYVGGAASGVSQYTRYTGTTIQATASGIYTFSIFVRPGATNPLNFCSIEAGLFSGISPDPARSFFSLSSGTAITSGARIENYGNGWYRLISAPFTLAAGDLSGTVLFSLAPSGTSTSWAASGATNLTVYTWGAQFEAGSVATSYIPTTTGTGSRSADVISVTGAVSGSIGQTEGTIYAEVDIRSFNNTGILATISDGTASNLLTIYKFTDSKIYFDRTSATQSATTTAGSSGTYTAPTILKIAIGYKSGETRMYINGVAVTAEQTATFTFGTLTKVNIGSSRFDGTFFNDRIRAVALYTTRLTNQQLQLLTTL